MTRSQDTTRLPDGARGRSIPTYTDDLPYSFRSRSRHPRRGIPNSNDITTYSYQDNYEEGTSPALGLNRDYYENYPADPSRGRKPKRRPDYGRRQYHNDTTSERLRVPDRALVAIDDGDFGTAAQAASDPDFYRWDYARSQSSRRELYEDQRNSRRRRDRKSYERGRSRGRSRGPPPEPSRPELGTWLMGAAAAGVAAQIAGATLGAVAVEAYRARHEAGTWLSGPRATRIGSAASGAAAVAAGAALATAFVGARQPRSGVTKLARP